LPLFYHKTVYNPLAHLYIIILHYTVLDAPKKDFLCVRREDAILPYEIKMKCFASKA